MDNLCWKRRKRRRRKKVEKVVNERVVVDKGKGHVEADSPIFMPQWKVRSSDTTKNSVVCHEMLKNMATPTEKEALSKLSGEDAAYRVITQVARLITFLPDNIEGWAASVSKNDDFAASLLDKEAELKTSQDDLAAFQVKVNDLEGQLLSSKAKMAEEMKKVEGEAIKKLHAFKPDLPDFVSAVKKMEVLSYPYVEALSQMVDCPKADLEALESEGLNKELCEQLLSIASIKRAFFETSDEEGGDASPFIKKLKVTPEPESVSSMSIPIDDPHCPLRGVSRLLLWLMMMKALMIQMAYTMTLPITRILSMRALVAQAQLDYVF
ncbi:hypothetical protein Hanom_Chr11g01011801 [Helianthus anomalus]